VTKDDINKTISLYSDGKIKQVKIAQTIMNKLINTKKDKGVSNQTNRKGKPKGNNYWKIEKH